MALRRLGVAGGLILLALASTGCFLVQSSPNPGIENNDLAAVSCPTADWCTAVGGYTNSGSPGQTLVETGDVDGVTWSVVPSPSPSTIGNRLEAVTCLSMRFCMASGQTEYNSGPPLNQSLSTTLTERWDGTTWSVVPSPGTTANSDLDGVSCLSKTMCTAVGTGTSSGSQVATLVETWDGTTWSVVPSPSPSTFGNSLSAVSCVSTSFCAAVGANSAATFDSYATLVEMWDGTTWSVVPSPSPSTASLPISLLSGVSCISSSSCTAVGEYRPDTNHMKTLVEVWNGTTWSVVPSPSESSIGIDSLSSVSCVSTNSCTAAGDFNNGSVTQTLVESFNGTSWSVVPSPNSSSSDSNGLSGVSCSGAGSGTCTAVGLFQKDNGPGPSHTLILHDVAIN